MTKQDLLDKKLRLANEAKQILDAAHADGREALRKEEEEKFETIHKDIEAVRKHIDMIVRQEAADADNTESVGRRTDPNQLETRERTETTSLSRGHEDTDLAMRGWMLTQMAASDLVTSDMVAAGKRTGIDFQKRDYTIKLPKTRLKSLRHEDLRDQEQRMSQEYRAQSLTSAAGGYTVNPELIREFERALLWYGPMLRGDVVRQIRTDTGATLPFPTVNDTTNKGVRLAENTGAAQQDFTFSIMNLGAFKYSSKMVLVSAELLQDSGINLPEFLGSALGERIGRIVNDETTVGTGTTMPWGIVTRAAAFNAPSGTATVFGSTTAIAYANLVNFLHSVDVAYRQGAKFMMHDLTLAKIKALTDTTGRPVWAPSFATNVPDTLFGYPYVINNSMVSTLANGVRSIVFGELQKYIVREVRGITILRSDERFIDSHQSAFLAFARYDADLLNAGTGPVNAFIHTT
jgi:HK97 family phage major capsid protein